MSTPSKQHTRADRLREYARAIDAATSAVAAMGALVRGREARASTWSEPPEVVFASTAVDERALPAAVWVALRRDDTGGAVEAMAAASQTPFLVASREEMGQGYKLQTVQESRPLPEIDLLLGQLSAMLDIPQDVLGMLTEWGADDARTQSEIDDLLDRRFGPAGNAAAPPVVRGNGLTMTVAETVDVLQLSAAQAKVLETLVRRVGVTITA
jgi:hypothetical protein